jgi:heptosyltransferase II
MQTTFRERFPAYAEFLVFAHSGIGDTIWLLSTLRALRRVWPGTAVKCTVNSLSREILAMAGLDLDFIAWPKYWRRSSVDTLAGLLSLSRCRPDVLMVPPSFDAWLASWVALLSHAPKRVAIVSHRNRWRPAFSFLVGKAFTDLIAKSENLHWVDQIHSMLRRVGPSVELGEPRLVVKQSVLHDTRVKMLRTAGLDMDEEPFLVAHLGCEPLRRAKLWPTEKMMSLLRGVSDKMGLKCVMVWGLDDVDLLKDATQIAGRDGWFVPVPWAASVTETAAIVSKAQLLITHDSGIMHLAAALGIKVLALFGPTSYRLCGPYSSRSAVVHHEVECGPCYPRKEFFDCPHGRRCLSEIPHDLVVDVACKMLDGLRIVSQAEIADKLFLSPSPCIPSIGSDSSAGLS